MKALITQSLTCIVIFLVVWGIIQLTMDVIGWFYLYLLIAGYLAFIIVTSRYKWTITILQFVVVGFISFMIIGFLYNKVYEPFIEQNFPLYESSIATTIGLIELIVIKLLSDSILSRTKFEKKKSLIEKILLPTLAKKT